MANLFDRFGPRRQLHAVFPLAYGPGKEAEDLLRASTLVRSLRAGFDRTQLLHLHVVGRATQLDAIRATLSPYAAAWLKISLHDEVALVPEMAGTNAHGWHRQQLIKFAAAEWLGADYWLTLDADVVCIRRFGIDDLIPDGRGLVEFIPLVDKIFGDWVNDAARIIYVDQPADPTLLNITPLIYSRAVMSGLLARIGQETGVPWRRALLRTLQPGETLQRNFGNWTEMALYSRFVQRDDWLQRYHAVTRIDTKEQVVGRGGIPFAINWADWQPSADALSKGPGFFIVCGSHTGVPAAIVNQRLTPILQAMDVASAQSYADAGGVEDKPIDDTTLRVRILSRRPLILMGALDKGDACFVAPGVLQQLRDIPAYFLISLQWSHEDMTSAMVLAEMLAQRRRDFPNHSFFVLCNAPQEMENFRRLGVASALLNHNIFADQSLYRPMPGEPKKFDALYNAGFVEWKRHRLARDIRSLALMFAPWHRNEHTEDYIKSMRAELSHATFLNQPSADDEYRFIWQEDVTRHINRARVGLCLSAVEGAMYSSVEYLLCGIPIVSTPSQGGRDVFFAPDYALIVEPEPRAVAAGVAEMIRRNIPPQQIREAVLARIVPQRQNFLRLLTEIFRREKVDQPADLAKLFTGPPFETMNFAELRQRIVTD